MLDGKDTSASAYIPRFVMQKVSGKMLPLAGWAEWALANGFEYIRFNDAQARTFLLEHFRAESLVVLTWDKLKPGSYRADLFRYAWLYISGGLYVDADTVPLEYRNTSSSRNAINLFFHNAGNNETRNNTAILSMDYSEKKSSTPRYWTGFMAWARGHDVMKRALSITVKNALTEDYTCTPLGISGPEVLGQAVGVFMEEPGLYFDGWRVLHSPWHWQVKNSLRKYISKRWEEDRSVWDHYHNMWHFCNVFNSTKILNSRSTPVHMGLFDHIELSSFATLCQVHRLLA